MSARNRVFAGILLIYVLGVAFLLYRIIADLDPRYRESAEESLVDTAHLLASFIGRDVKNGVVGTDNLRAVFPALYSRRFQAHIYSLEKTRVELRVYVTDTSGRVVFDSLGRAEGADFSQWRDVKKSLEGEYGARTTPDIPGNAASAVMYVGAPIYAGGRIVGAVTAGKPVQSFGQFVDASRRKIILVGAGSVAAVLVLAVIMSIWLVRPFGVVADYVRYVRAQRRLSLPRLGRRALGAIGAAYQEMRDALAGRHYVSEYVQTLTHEIKSPLSAIRGAAELLQEPMPEAERQRFVANIGRESERIQALVDRLLELAGLEARGRLDKVEREDLGQILDEAVQAALPTAQRRGVALVRRQTGDDSGGASEGAWVEGDRFLLQRALANLLDNAIDFSPEGGEVELVLSGDARTLRVQVRDHGPGIPAYAADKVFEKFYSLPRPHSRKKSTGMGLAFVREIAELHHGRVTLANAPGGGAVACLELPRF
jgi:two-component system sensor histidine kinase CreC